jgi:hypothetical protein
MSNKLKIGDATFNKTSDSRPSNSTPSDVPPHHDTKSVDLYVNNGNFPYRIRQQQTNDTFPVPNANFQDALKKEKPENLRIVVTRSDDTTSEYAGIW